MEPSTSSPIDCLVQSLAASPYRVAPERQEALHQTVQRHDVNIEYRLDRDDSLLAVSPPAAIQFGVPFAERLWAFCYGYGGLMAFLEARGNEPGDVLLPADAPWMRLLNWAMSYQRRTGHPHWPTDLPRPQAEP